MTLIELRHAAGLVLAACLAMGAGAAPAATLQVSLPTVTVAPGDTAVIAFDTLPSPAGLGIQAIEYRLVLGAAVVQSARVLNDGFLWTWGAPFVNANPGFVAAAAAGVTAVTGSTIRLSSVEVVVLPSVPVGTDLPLTFSKLMFNEGTPTVSWTSGVLQVRSAPTAVETPVVRGFALESPAPNPATRDVRLRWSLPAGAGSGARLEVFDLSGRRVRSFASVAAAPGGEWTWDLRDDAGRALGDGVYLVRLRAGSGSRVRRLAVIR